MNVHILNTKEYVYPQRRKVDIFITSYYIVVTSTSSESNSARQHFAVTEKSASCPLSSFSLLITFLNQSDLH